MIVAKEGYEELVLAEIARLESLLADLRAIAAGSGPSLDQLEAAPTIGNVTISLRQHACLNGFTIGHPRLGTTKLRTSDLWVYAPKQRWARTYSRFYRLQSSDLPEVDDNF